MNGLLAVTIVLMAAVIFSLPAMAQTAQSGDSCILINVNASLCDDAKDASGWIWNYTSNDFENTKKKTVIFDLKNSWEKFGLCVNLTLELNTNDRFNATIDDLQPSCINDSISYILNKWDNWTSYSEAQDACDANPFDEAAIQSAIWFYWYMNESTCENGFSVDEFSNWVATNKSKDNGGSDWIPNCTAHPEACWLIDNVTKAKVNETGVPTSLALQVSDGLVYQPIEIKAKVTNESSYPLENVNVQFTLLGDAATYCYITENNGDSYVAATDNNGYATVHVTCTSSGTNYPIKAEIVDWKRVKLVDPQACPNQKQFQETVILDPIVASGKFNVTQNPTTTPPTTTTPPQVSVDSPTSIGFLFAVIAILGALLITRRR